MGASSTAFFSSNAVSEVPEAPDVLQVGCPDCPATVQLSCSSLADAATADSQFEEGLVDFHRRYFTAVTPELVHPEDMGNNVPTCCVVDLWTLQAVGLGWRLPPVGSILLVRRWEENVAEGCQIAMPDCIGDMWPGGEKIFPDPRMLHMLGRYVRSQFEPRGYQVLGHLAGHNVKNNQ